MPNTMMLVTKMAAPLPSRTAELLLTSPVTIARSSLKADSVLSTAIAASSTQLTYFPVTVERVRRTGLMTTSTRTRAISRDINGQRGTSV